MAGFAGDSGENSRTKVQNVGVDSTVGGGHESIRPGFQLHRSAWLGGDTNLLVEESEIQTERTNTVFHL